MTSLVIGSVLLGTVFGRIFKVWVLVPACALTFAIVIANSVYYQHGLASALLEFTLDAAGLQIGYVYGCLSYVIGDGWRRLNPHNIPRIRRELSHPAARRRRQLF